MLPLRKKPPSGLPTINAGEPWSDMDLADLDEFVAAGKPIGQIAEYLCRGVDEVEAKVASLRGPTAVSAQRPERRPPRKSVRS